MATLCERCHATPEAWMRVGVVLHGWMHLRKRLSAASVRRWGGGGKLLATAREDR